MGRCTRVRVRRKLICLWAASPNNCAPRPAPRGGSDVGTRFDRDVAAGPRRRLLSTQITHGRMFPGALMRCTRHTPRVTPVTKHSVAIGDVGKHFSPSERACRRRSPRVHGHRGSLAPTGCFCPHRHRGRRRCHRCCRPLRDGFFWSRWKRKRPGHTAGVTRQRGPDGAKSPQDGSSKQPHRPVHDDGRGRSLEPTSLGKHACSRGNRPRSLRSRGATAEASCTQRIGSEERQLRAARSAATDPQSPWLPRIATGIHRAGDIASARISHARTLGAS